MTKTLNGALWYLILFVLILVAIASIDGFVVLRLYQWFVEPVFTSAPHIQLMQAIGLSIFVGFITRQAIYAKAEDDPKKKYINIASWVFFGPLVTLAFGYVLQLFM